MTKDQPEPGPRTLSGVGEEDEGGKELLLAFQELSSVRPGDHDRRLLGVHSKGG